MKFRKLLNDYVLIKLDEVAEKTPGGIIVKDTVAQPVRSGRVLMAGPGRQFPDRYVPSELATGDRVYFFIASADLKAGQAYRAKLNDGEVFVREQDVLFVSEDNIRVEV